MLYITFSLSNFRLHLYLAIVNNAAVNIGVHILFWISVLVSLSKNLEMELLGCVIVLFLVFWGTSIPFSIVAAPIYIPTNSILLLLLLSHFSCVQLCDPRGGSPLGSPVPGILQARTLKRVTISFSKGSHFATSSLTPANLLSFDSNILDRCDISLWFWFAFPWWLVILNTFSGVCWPSICLLGKMSILIFCPLKN